MNLEPEDQLTDEEEARVARLTPGELARIDAALLSHVRFQRRKVAMIVSLAMSDVAVEIENIPAAFYALRVAHLVSQGKLEAFGDLRRMRYSEVNLP